MSGNKLPSNSLKLLYISFFFTVHIYYFKQTLHINIMSISQILYEIPFNNVDNK